MTGAWPESVPHDKLVYSVMTTVREREYFILDCCWADCDDGAFRISCLGAQLWVPAKCLPGVLRERLFFHAEYFSHNLGWAASGLNRTAIQRPAPIPHLVQNLVELVPLTLHSGD